ncbi:jg7129 [Pararge aegeria aegeria]|uniref:Jg7129 protein n=1 Tax=Pararge aegeria aegeria TaxID=348720 RepID=A0A8S4S5T2_9NEOP|nr:jg7129 [Pararge aegeria aegeria]
MANRNGYRKQLVAFIQVRNVSSKQIFLSWVLAFDEAVKDKTLNLKIGFDLYRGKNGAPSLRIRNFKEIPEFGKENFQENKKKRSQRTESSVENDETGHDKIVSKVNKATESNGSDEEDTSGSDDDRRRSTKGILPDEFEHENADSPSQWNVPGGGIWDILSDLCQQYEFC